MADQSEQLSSTGTQGTSAPPDDIPQVSEEQATADLAAATGKEG